MRQLAKPAAINRVCNTNSLYSMIYIINHMRPQTLRELELELCWSLTDDGLAHLTGLSQLTVSAVQYTSERQ